jgi:hypothetical protein
MTATHFPRHDASVFKTPITANNVIGAVAAAALVLAAVIAFKPAPTSHAVTARAPAIHAVQADGHLNRGGAITGYQLLL